MIIVVVGDNQTLRRTHIDTVINQESDVLYFDDTYGSLRDLEQFLYPSLFSAVAPVVHVKYMLESDTLAPEFIKKLLASPTLFLFEEIALPSPLLSSYKKLGAVVHAQEKEKKSNKQSDIFAATLALTAKDKKSRWLAYHAALESHPIEAIIGILYWKLKDLITKNPAQKKIYLPLYRALIEAHAAAWKEGTPLTLAIEKVILTQ